MKKFVSGLVTVGLLSVAGSAFAHPHTTEGSGQELANGASHPAFAQVEPGYFVSSGFDAYVDTQVALYGASANSANSGYGLETAHHGVDQGTPGKADDQFAGYGETTAKSPEDSNPGIK